MNINEIFAPLYGKFCWQAQKGYGSFLTFEFGEPHLAVLERQRTKEGVSELRRLVVAHGDWYLWIYLCDWQIVSHDKVLASSSSPTRQIRKAMLRLDGQVLKKVQVEPDARTAFHFEHGDRLETFPNIAEYEADSEQWLLFEPSKMVFSLRADLKYSHHPGDTTPDKVTWLSGLELT